MAKGTRPVVPKAQARKSSTLCFREAAQHEDVVDLLHQIEDKILERGLLVSATRDSESDITLSFDAIPIRGSIVPCLIIDIITGRDVNEAGASYRRLRDYVLEKYGELSAGLPRGVADVLDGSSGPILRVNHRSPT
ncbi:MAG: hypothetical protein KGN77_15060 [Xanthomonadaceae bacterium]|nr:hypothetical protein [Xanthomonadaceae bacterium]MDE1964103.1 hypothetical protein [Xanthomonadaceae bacterium]